MANQSMAIEASAETTEDAPEKEWYYSMSTVDKERNGPISFKELKEMFEQKSIHAKTKVSKYSH